MFIGNSLTSANDLPRAIADLAESRNSSLEYSAHTPGGCKLSGHVVDPRLLGEINKANWDFVVLQEQSQLPSFSEEQVQEEVYPFAQRLCQLVRNANSRTRIAFYETMANRYGDPQNAPGVSELGTYEGMQRRINASYTRMAQQNKGLLVPVGLVWEKVRLKRPSLVLYADDTHPNVVGTYLAACVFYARLFNDSPIGLPYPPMIDGATADFLQRMTDETVGRGSAP